VKEASPKRPSIVSTNEWLRLPGLYRRWELQQVIEPGEDFYVEDAGVCEDGTSLLAIYHRPHAGEEARDE